MKQLEAKSIFIIREVATEFEKPVMLYSIGKDSSVILSGHESIFPDTLPFPLLHVDTAWKFREMIEFRDRLAREQGLDLLSLRMHKVCVRALTRLFTAVKIIRKS